jgi:hypothetical protein
MLYVLIVIQCFRDPANTGITPRHYDCQSGTVAARNLTEADCAKYKKQMQAYIKTRPDKSEQVQYAKCQPQETGQ